MWYWLQPTFVPRRHTIHRGTSAQHISVLCLARGGIKTNLPSNSKHTPSIELFQQITAMALMFLFNLGLLTIKDFFDD